MNCILSGFPMNENLKKGFNDIISTLNRVDQVRYNSIVDNTVTPDFVLVIIKGRKEYLCSDIAYNTAQDS